MKHEMDVRLKQAFCEDYFRDADAERIWTRAAERCCAEKRRYVVPATVCAVAAVAILAAVPPVRAAVADFFITVGSYMATPAEERPEVEGVNIQKVEAGKPQTGPWSTAAPESRQGGMGTAQAVSGTESWIGDIGEITIKEALYDGEKLYLTYTVEGTAVDLIAAFGDDVSRQRLEEAEGDSIRVHGLVSSYVWLAGEETDLPAIGYDWNVKNRDGALTVTTEYAGLPRLSGEQELTLRLQFSDYELSKEQGEGGEFHDSTFISIPFTINMDSSVTRLDDNQEIDGTEVSAEVLVKPTEISVTFQVSRMIFFEQYEPIFYLNGELVEEMQSDYTSGSTDLEPAIGRWYAPFPEATDVREFVIQWVDADGKTPENGEMSFPAG